MSQTALVNAIKRFDLRKVQALLDRDPDLKQLRVGKGFDLLQFCCSRSTVGGRAAGDQQLRLAKWLVENGFNPRVVYTTAPGEDGEADPAELSLAFFAVARAQNNRLARFFLQQGASPSALFAAAWWGNAEIVADLVKHGANINVVVGATPLHMAVAVVRRGVEGKPELSRRRLRLVKELLALGADPNIPSTDGTTPLRTALDRGYLDVFKLLVKHGANPDAAGKDRRTIRAIATRKKDKRFVNALRSSARLLRP